MFNYLEYLILTIEEEKKILNNNNQIYIYNILISTLKELRKFDNKFNTYIQTLIEDENYYLIDIFTEFHNSLKQNEIFTVYIDNVLYNVLQLTENKFEEILLYAITNRDKKDFKKVSEMYFWDAIKF